MFGSSWKGTVLVLAIASPVVLWFCRPATALQTNLQEPLVFEEIITGLHDKSGNDLQDFLLTLQMRLDATDLSSGEIAQIVEELQRIARDNSSTAPGRGTAIFPTRIAAQALIPRLESKNTQSRLRSLPEDQRLRSILDEMETDAELSREHRTELVGMGKKAVPPLLERAPGLTKHQGMAISVLGEIADPAAIDFIGGVLKDRAHAGEVERILAAQALGAFEGEKVIRLLVEALNDDSFQIVNRCAEEKNRADYHPCQARYFQMQHLVAESLGRVAGRHWGWLYQEDFKTWSTWLEAKDRASFRPSDVQRTPEELDLLMERLVHRYMSGRPNPYMSENSLDDPIAVKTLARDLAVLGGGNVDRLVRRCKEQVAAAPVWKGRLTPWTLRVLRAMNMTEATAAADALERPSSQEVDGKDQ